MRNEKFVRALTKGATCFAAVALSLHLAGCGSSVKLSDGAPVESGRTQTATAAPPTAVASAPANLPAAQTQTTNQREVAAVNTPAVGAGAGSNAATAPPASVARVILFDYDSYEIKPEFQAALDAHARFLKSAAVRKVSLEGHTDERGGREYNLALGQKRSEAVARALRALGVADAQTEAVSFGKEKPAATGADEATWAKNRRVELFYK